MSKYKLTICYLDLDEKKRFHSSEHNNINTINNKVNLILSQGLRFTDTFEEHKYELILPPHRIIEAQIWTKEDDET